MQSEERILFFECLGGASGDMCLGALLDLGYPLEELRRSLSHLGLDDYYEIAVERFAAGSIDSLRVFVKLTQHETGHRHLAQIRRIIQESGLPERVRERSVRIFQRLAEAEAKVHGTTPEKVHFHEVGAVDAIVDIVGTCLAVEYFDPKRMWRSPLVTGRGQVQCQHGLIPVPAPAVMNLALGSTVRFLDVEAELTTPTGAAILTTLAEERSAAQFRVERVGYGGGHREVPGLLNLMRVSLGIAGDSSNSGEGF
ncbi:MAG TPA: LarC family nickel insertion protein [bacterium]|nr:LarC family nickel insertion protein [bacterium]HQL61464.1 LarC family nickel insertion protein [bacterium]